MNAVKNATVAIQTKATEELPANFTEPKKQIQCKATMTPIIRYCQMYFLGIVFNDFPKRIKKNKLMEVKSTRHHTIDIAGREIN